MGSLQKGASSRVEVFQYPASAKALSTLWQDIPEVGETTNATACTGNRYGPEDPACEPSRASAAEEARSSFDAGREQGMREAREIALKEQCSLLQEADAKRVELAAKFADQVANDRDRFVREAEQEIVHLALAIAARILRREAQMDPLFLIGAVRVALGQLSATMQVRLRVPASEFTMWTETLAHLPNLKTKPTLMSEAGMGLGDCVIETEMGSVDLGLRAQLLQMEGALFEGAPARKSDARADLQQNQKVER